MHCHKCLLEPDGSSSGHPWLAWQRGGACLWATGQWAYRGAAVCRQNGWSYGFNLFSRWCCCHFLLLLTCLPMTASPCLKTIGSTRVVAVPWQATLLSNHSWDWPWQQATGCCKPFRGRGQTACQLAFFLSGTASALVRLVYGFALAIADFSYELAKQLKGLRSYAVRRKQSSYASWLAAFFSIGWRMCRNLRLRKDWSLLAHQHTLMPASTSGWQALAACSPFQAGQG